MLPERTQEPENWYTEPFTKRTGCKTPGQCGGDCKCGCPYNTMTEVERLPLIEDIAGIFPNEWLAFIISPVEDEEYEPIHGKLIAHSPDPDEVYNAVNAVLWNQHVYVYFNGVYETMKASYGSEWAQPSVPVVKRAYSGPQAGSLISGTPPEDLTELIYSALDQLYDGPRLNEAIRRLRLARVRAVRQDQEALAVALDTALDMLEIPHPVIDEVIWQLEEALVA
jgi:hypothetical protein